MKILHLTLHRKYYDEILSGIKTIEFRKIKPYWERRLDNRKYDYIHFVNGYGKDKPWMDVELIRIEKEDVYYEEYKLHLGKVLRSGNLRIV